MVGRHRHLRGADEVHVLALDPVDVVGRLAEEAGAVHRPRLDHRRRDHLGEAVLAGVLVGEVDQRELELGADAGEEVEPRARHLGAALDVDGAEDPAELDVVARLEVELARRADRLEHREVVLATGRRLVGGQVGDRPAARRATPARRRSARPRPPSPRRRASWSARAAPASRRPAPAGSACRASSARARLASKAAIASRRAASAASARSTDVAGQPALGLGGAHSVRLVSEDPRVDHAARLLVDGGRSSPELRRGLRHTCPGTDTGGNPLLDRSRTTQLEPGRRVLRACSPSWRWRSSRSGLWSSTSTTVARVARLGGRHSWLHDPLRWVEVAFGTVGMTVLTRCWRSPCSRRATGARPRSRSA